jgi:hypothetical protein
MGASTPPCGAACRTPTGPARRRTGDRGALWRSGPAGLVLGARQDLEHRQRGELGVAQLGSKPHTGPWRHQRGTVQRQIIDTQQSAVARASRSVSIDLTDLTPQGPPRHQTTPATGLLAVIGPSGRDCSHMPTMRRADRVELFAQSRTRGAVGELRSVADGSSPNQQVAPTIRQTLGKPTMPVRRPHFDLIASVSLVAALIGCGGGASDEDGGPDPSKTTESTTTTQPAATDAARVQSPRGATTV